MKTRKFAKEQMKKYLDNHGSSMAEAARIAGTSPRTLVRYLDKGVIPSEWLALIYSELRDRKKPAPKKELKKIICASCGKQIKVDIPNKPTYSTNNIGLKNLGVSQLPKKGYYMSPISAFETFFSTALSGKTKCRMYPVCEDCHTKLEEVHGSKKGTKAKKTVKIKK